MKGVFYLVWLLFVCLFALFFLNRNTMSLSSTGFFFFFIWFGFDFFLYLMICENSNTIKFLGTLRWLSRVFHYGVCSCESELWININLSPSQTESWGLVSLSEPNWINSFGFRNKMQRYDESLFRVKSKG